MAKRQIEKKRATLKRAQEQLTKARQRRADVFARQQAAEERVKVPKVTATFAQREAARRALVKAEEALARADKRVGDVQERIALLEREIERRHEPPLCDETTCPPEELERRKRAREAEERARAEKRKPKASKAKASKAKAAKPKPKSTAPGVPAAGYGEEQTIGEQRAGLDAAILRLVRAAKEPVFLDDLLKRDLPVRGLGVNVRASIRGSLARLAKAGKIELRPEAGSLAAHELGMPGPQGSILSYARAVGAEPKATKPSAARQKLEAEVWKHTHKDFKSTRDDGTRVVLVNDPQRGTISAPLRSLSDDELKRRLPKDRAPSDFDRMDRMFQHRLLEEVRSMLTGPRAAKYRADRAMLRRGARTLPEFRDSPDATIDEAVERVERELATKATPQKREPVKSSGPAEAKAIRVARLPVGSKHEILEDVTRSEAPVYSILSDGAEIAEVRRVNGDFKASLPKDMITPAVVERLERRAPGAGQALAERARQMDELAGVMPSQLKRGQTYRDTRDDKLITITKVVDAQDDEPLVGANWTQDGAPYAGLVDVRHLVRVKAPKAEKTVSRGKGGSFKVALRDPLGMRDVKGTRYGPVFVFDRKQIEERPISRWGVNEIESGKAIQSFDAAHEAIAGAKWIAEHESIFQRALGGDKTAVAQLNQGVREALGAARRKREGLPPVARVGAPVKQAKGKAEITIQDPAGGTRKASGELHGPVAIIQLGDKRKPLWSLTDVTTGARVQGYRKKADALAAARWIKRHEDLYRRVVEAMTAGKQPNAAELQQLMQATAKGKI